jgi:hypothetical protein
MRKLLATVALTVLMPFAASAQYIVPEVAEAEQKAMLDRLLSAGPNLESNTLVPMWSTPDGRILVAVAQAGPPQPPIAPASPQVGTALDWRLIDATTLLDGRVGVRLGENTQLHGGLSLAPLALAEPTLALDCFNSGYLGVTSPDCHSTRGDLHGGNWYGGNIGASWAGTEFGLELGLALSWL